MGNGSKFAVEFIGNVKLVMSSSFVLSLSPVLYVRSMRSLISASKLVESGITFVGDNESVKFYHYDNKAVN